MNQPVFCIPGLESDLKEFYRSSAARPISLVHKVDFCGIESTLTAPGIRPAAVIFIDKKLLYNKSIIN